MNFGLPSNLLKFSLSLSLSHTHNTLKNKKTIKTHEETKKNITINKDNQNTTHSHSLSVSVCLHGEHFGGGVCPTAGHILGVGPVDSQNLVLVANHVVQRGFGAERERERGRD